MINDFDKPSISMIDWSCAHCGCTQWMPKAFNDQLRTSHGAFYCVNGHGNVYNKKTDIEDVQGKLLNEYSKNAQLESKISEMGKEIGKAEEVFCKQVFLTLNGAQCFIKIYLHDKRGSIRKGNYDKHRQ